MKSLTEGLETAGDQADLTPLIDCVFLLLLFFIVTAVFVEETNLFKVELPRAAQAEVRRVTDVVVVAVSRSGEFALERSYVTDDQFYARLKQINDRAPIETLIIKGDRRCPYEKVVLAMDVAQALDIGEISLAVEAE